MYQDKMLVCKTCGQPFVFSASEQEFYAEKGFHSQPKHCPQCRRARKSSPKAGKPRYTGVCAACGKEAVLPFQPREDQLVYCSRCYAIMRAEKG